MTEGRKCDMRCGINGENKEGKDKAEGVVLFCLSPETLNTH